MSLKEYLKKLNLVDPFKIKVEIDDKRNALKINIDGISYYNIIPRRPFPFSHPEFIIFVTKNGEEICMVKNYMKMDKDSRKAVDAFLEKIYFVPRITKIKKVDYRAGEYKVQAETDKGERTFSVRGRRSIHKLPDGRILIQDRDDNIYEIHPWSLDKKSRENLELIL
ncbi:MAG: DUF1854 domain-containing protein [Thermoproteales archaeon]|nr:DUF1854 domain-containing protein [Thermoproteales archaeon]RLE63847.1 MAG: hypothetical protein DRJ47_08910 [Thermoprotei archaeon]